MLQFILIWMKLQLMLYLSLIWNKNSLALWKDCTLLAAVLTQLTGKSGIALFLQGYLFQR